MNTSKSRKPRCPCVNRDSSWLVENLRNSPNRNQLNFSATYSKAQRNNWPHSCLAIHTHLYKLYAWSFVCGRVVVEPLTYLTLYIYWRYTLLFGQRFSLKVTHPFNEGRFPPSHVFSLEVPRSQKLAINVQL